MEKEELVVVESMPPCIRSSHTAAGNCGIYPHNGAERVVMDRECAEHIIDDDWTFIVRKATPKDMEHYERNDSFGLGV